jgi:three-Cys-motif partner protein
MSDLFHKNIPAQYVSRVFDTMESADWHVYQVLTKRSSLMRNFVNQRYPDQPVPAHIWLGTSIEDASTLGRLRHLQQANASIRFVSFEPLIGPVGRIDLTGVRWVIAGGESGPGARAVEAEWLREIRDQCVQRRVAFFFKQWGGRTPKAGGNMLDGQQWLQYPDAGLSSATVTPLRAVGAPPEDDDTFEQMTVGPWAREKLNCLRKYLSAYTTILSKQRFKGYFYIDAFAGPGSLEVRRQQAHGVAQQSLLELAAHATEHAGEAEYIEGSPRIALGLDRPFTHYVFIEQDSGRIARLQTLAQTVSGPKIYIKQQDCNAYLRRLLRRNQGKWHQWRGVVFLDPFGMHVPWSTIAELGRTRAIEVFINFPVGMAIQRLLKRSGDFTSKERAKLDDYFGTDEWYHLLYRTGTDLIGDRVAKVRDASDVLVKWYRKRLQDEFGYVTTAREIQTPSGRPLYYLIFAGPNKTGAEIARHVLNQGARQVR